MTERLAQAWRGHLLGGGTTPWAQWAQRPASSVAADSEIPRGGPLPGAQQLELLRRMNLVGRPSGHLARRVLAAGAPGRGALDLPLLGAGERRRFGPPPVDPGRLPDAELVRIAAGLLADDLAAAGLPPPPPSAVPRPWRVGYHLGGDPWLAGAAVAELTRRGRPPGGRRPRALVVGSDLATMLTDVWTARCFAQPPSAWREWLDPIVAGSRLPPRIDLAREADTWADRVGAHRVRLVLDQARLPRLLGVRALTGPPRLSADAVELVRRVGMVLGVQVALPVRERLLREVLLPRLRGASGAPLGVPAEHRQRLRRRAARLREELRGRGYAVVGDPASLVPPPEPPEGPARAGADPTGADPTGADPTDGDPTDGDPTDGGVLALAVRLLVEEGAQ